MSRFVASKMVRFKLVKSLPDVLTVRVIRNECRHFLTNFTGYIPLLRQVWWYFTSYRKGLKSGNFRLYLAKNGQGRAVGYGALHRIGNSLLVTECVLEKDRGQGYGRAILNRMILLAQKRRLPLVAEIRATNKISRALHTKSGFTHKTSRIKSGFKLLVYVKNKK